MDSKSLSWPDPATIVTFEDGDPDENPWVLGYPQTEEIQIEVYSPEWASLFASAKYLIDEALPGVALSIEHVGSTAVPGLPAKPVVDIDLIVAEPEQEEQYVPALTALGYRLTVRERSWYQHRMLRHDKPRVNLHVFGTGCPEHIRHVLFRNWLCDHPEDRERYANTKMMAKNGVSTAQDYNRNKQAVVRDIYRMIFEHRGWVNAG
ncbi:GrpB family protein [Pseudaminobacter soli (ex Li et al. 2025)]|uniref:GrpB family protein n=1 Tax=Pseudaminobacter soli (ex Li et al. 2025) TaxID=1295366 RepID=A0A2P7RSG6_9HYPH|nr:GrpB family protein [Mesorhizobium soli]PSJ53140.1 GrpB family protein [Mesorhizobium soli]